MMRVGVSWDIRGWCRLLRSRKHALMSHPSTSVPLASLVSSGEILRIGLNKQVFYHRKDKLEDK